MNDESTSKTRSQKRADFLRQLVVFTMVMGAIYFVSTLVAAVTSHSLLTPLTLDVPADSIAKIFPPSAPVEAAQASFNVKVGLGYRVGWWAVTDAAVVLGIGFLEILRRMLSDASDPFTQRNVARLRTMMVLVVAYAVVQLLKSLVSVAIQKHVGFEGIQATWDNSSLVVLFVIGALLSVWRHGLALRNEQELTI